MLMQVRVIDRVGNPVLSNEPEVVVRRTAVLRLLNPAHLWHPWTLTRCSGLLSYDFSEQQGRRIGEWVSIWIPSSPSGNGVELLQGGEKNANGTRAATGQKHEFIGIVWASFAV
jgi:hypothetical protein